MKAPLYRHIAGLIQARDNCRRDPSDSRLKEWKANHERAALEMVRDHLPSGSGFDNSTSIYLDDSKPNRLVLTTSFHHMNEHGSYDGWTQHKVIVTPSLVLGFELRVTGRDRNGIKDYIADCFEAHLSAEVER